jgi:hypothetical protein
MTEIQTFLLILLTIYILSVLISMTLIKIHQVYNVWTLFFDADEEDSLFIALTPLLNTMVLFILFLILIIYLGFTISELIKSFAVKHLNY